VLGTGVNATSYAWHRWMQWTAQSFTAIGEAERYVATETLRGFQDLRRRVIPSLIAAAVGPLGLILGRTVTHTKSVERVVTQEVPKITRVVKQAVTNVYPTTVKVERIGKAALARAVAVAGGLAIPRLGQLERDLAAAKARLGKIVKTLTPAGVLGLVLSAVAALDLGWTRCANVKKVGKGVCGLSPSLLDDLLLGLVSIFGTLSLVELAEQYQKLIKDVSGEVTHFWRADTSKVVKDRALGQTGL
jgi:hypothetical protein